MLVVLLSIIHQMVCRPAFQRSRTKKWANMPGNSRIVFVTVNENMLNEAYYSSRLDNIGPAYYFELEALNLVLGREQW
ncbi:hypothetical protein D3C76_665940 [compost metagenome]